jgi:hypothetical protein
MILDHNWQFDAAAKVAMPSGTTGIITNVIDWTASAWKDWINSPQPLWYIVVCVDVPDAGTSIKVDFYQHSTTTITSGDLLWTGPAITVANLSADPQNDGHVLAAIPLLTIMAAAQAMGGQDRYMGGVLEAVGNCSTGGVRAFLHIGVNPPIWVAPPTSSTIVMPT